MIIRKDQASVVHADEEDARYYGPSEWLHLSDEGGLTQFGAHTLRPGDAACWPAGEANAHQVVNRSGTLCSYLILGSRAIPDVVHYPDRGDVLYAFEDGSWRLQRTDGALIKEGRDDP